ncbi:unnamed protein product [Phytomonas sp. Hart1]|nr:unnamed protein product [Phytomonas sp. Hart1]|eukprot:CCW70341.1 unnamed protein product [Phytomonas sp. isolate Hart1]
MERRFRRQESASSSIDSGGLLRREMLGGGTKKSQHNSQVFAVNKEWQDYIAAVEGDHTELRQLYKMQTDELSSLRSLLAEKPIQDVLIQSLTSRVNEYEACMKELLVVLTNTEKLRERNNQKINKDGTKEQASAKNLTTDCASQLTMLPSTPVTLMDAVRDAVMKQQQRILNYQKTIERNQIKFKEIEEKLVTKNECIHKVNNKEAHEVPDSGIICDCFVPSSAKELDKLRMYILDLERHLEKAKENEKNIMAELRNAKHKAEVSSQSSQRYVKQLDWLKALLIQKENLLTDVETRYRTIEGKLKKYQLTDLDSTCSSLANDKNAKSDDAGDKLDTTHHCQLFLGKELVLTFLNTPEEFKDMFLGATSAALHLPRSWISITKTQLIGDRHGVSIELDVQHSASMKECTINSIIHAHSYHELQELKERALLRQLEITETTAHGIEKALHDKTQQVEVLQKRVHGLQRLLNQRNRDQESIDRQVDIALEEANVAVKDVYAALEAERLKTLNANEALQIAQEDAAVQLQKLANYEKQLEDAHKVIEAMQSQLKAVEEQLPEVDKHKMELDQSLQDLRQKKNKEPREATDTTIAGSVVETFALRLPLPLSDASEIDAAALFSSASDSGSHAPGKSSVAVTTLYRLLLCEASMATGTVPVRISRASMITKKMSPAQVPTLSLKLVLSCFVTTDKREAVCQNIAQKLSSCPFHCSLRYLQDHLEVSRELVNSKQVSTLTHNAKTTEKTIQTSTNSLQELIKILEDKFDKALRTADHRTAVGVQAKAEILIGRLHTLELTLRQTREATKENEKKLVDENNPALEQLRIELQSATQRCEELERQVFEMETDMNDFAKIQASLQDSFENAQTELRAKKQDHEYSKHYIRQIEKESERVKEENRRLRARALVVTAPNESDDIKGQSTGSGSSKANDSSEMRSVIATLHKTRSLLKEIMFTVQQHSGQSSDVSKPVAAIDPYKASTETYRLVRQLHSAITTLLSERKTSPKQLSESVKGSAATPCKRTPAAAPIPIESTKEYPKSIQMQQNKSTIKGSTRISSSPMEEERSKIGRTVPITHSTSTEAAFTRSATAACFRPRVHARAMGVMPTLSSSDESSQQKQSGCSSSSLAAGDGKNNGDHITEAMVRTHEHRFIYPVMRPPLLELSPGCGSPSSDAALSRFVTPQSFHRSHTDNDRLDMFRNLGDAKH